MEWRWVRWSECNGPIEVQDQCCPIAFKKMELKHVAVQRPHLCALLFSNKVLQPRLWACVSFKDCKDMCQPNSPRSWKTLKLYWYSVCSTVHSSGNPCGKTSLDIFWHQPAIVWTYPNTSKELSIVNWERDEDMRPIVRSQDSCWVYTCSNYVSII